MKTNQQSEDKLTWRMIFTEEMVGVTKIYIWETKCKRYRVYRLERKEGKFKVDFGSCYLTRNNDYWSVESDKLGVGYPKFYPSLYYALEAIERYHKEKVNNSIKTNSRVLLSFAGNLAE